MNRLVILAQSDHPHKPMTPNNPMGRLSPLAHDPEGNNHGGKLVVFIAYPSA